ncbi:MAG: ATP-binding protein [Bacteroidia bacterium]
MTSIFPCKLRLSVTVNFLLLALFLASFTPAGFSQFARGGLRQWSSSQLDSLHHAFASAQIPEQKSNAAFSLGMAFYIENLDSSLFFFREALSAANEEESIRKVPLSFQATNMLLNGHRKVGNVDSARYYAQLSVRLARTGEDSLLVADALHNRSGLYRRDMEFEAATTDALTALALLQHYAKGDIATRSIYLKHLGRIRLEREDYQLAIETFEKVVSLDKQYPNEVPRIQRGMSLYFMAIAQAKSGAYKKAESTLEAYAAFLAERSGNVAQFSGHASSVFLLRDTSLALNLYLASFDRYQRENNMLKARQAAANIASIYSDQGLPEEALFYAQSALLNNSLDPETYDFLLPRLVNIHETLGNIDSTLHYLRLQIAFRDSLNSLEQERRIDELEVAYGAREAKAALAYKAAKLAQSRTQRAGLIAALLVVAFVAILTATFFRQRLRLSEQIASQERSLIEGERLHHEKERQLTAVRSMVRGQEAERKRIAQDLHDGLGSLLTSTRAHLTIDDDTRQAKLSEAHIKGVALLDEACGEVRKISHALMPQALTLNNFTAAVTDLAEGLRSGGVEPQIEVAGQIDHRVGDRVQLSAYRMLQELIANTLKHGDATEVFIQLLVDGDRLVMLYEDDGNGFDENAQAKLKKGLGLPGLQSRVDAHGGELDLATAPGEGVSYTVVFSLVQSDS